MKYLVIPLILFIAGCTSSESESTKLNEYRERVYQLESQLSTCQAKLPYDTGSFNQPEPEPEQPEEPTCEDVEYTTIYQEGKLVATCRNTDRAECGINAEYCTNDYVYQCLTNVKLGSETKKVCN